MMQNARTNTGYCVDSVESVVAAFIYKDEMISAVHRTIVCRQQS